MSVDLDRTLAALADPSRRRVVDLLATRPRRAGDLARASRLSAPAMSRHLRVLRRCGLVEEQRDEDDARVRLYRLRKRPFDDLRSWLRQVEAFWTDQLHAFKEHAERRQRVERRPSVARRRRAARGPAGGRKRKGR